MTPFKAMYSRDLLTFLKLSDEPSAIEDVNVHVRNQIISLLTDNLAKAPSKVKAQADEHWRDVHFEIGDLLMWNFDLIG